MSPTATSDNRASHTSEPYALKKGHKYQPIVQELKSKIYETPGLEAAFEEAVKEARKSEIPALKKIKSMEDYYKYIDDLLRWIPSEKVQGKEVYNKICMFYFLLNQPTVKDFQSAISPESAGKDLTWLSKWLVRYAQEMGKFLDTPESWTEESKRSFYKSPKYNMNDYVQPHGGWKTFNEFFARYTKPGYRPIEDIANPNVIVSPADSTFDGFWHIEPDSMVELKGIRWNIEELLRDSKYADRFKNGVFMHSFLNTTDYHRQHTPVEGTVLESRVIQGQVYLEVKAGSPKVEGEEPRLKMRRVFDAQDEAGYQFCQTRGLVVLDTPIGLVAVLPIGMAQVSSVILTAEVGRKLRKGEEISYFQFGGSDIVLVFEGLSNVEISAQVNTHYKMGQQIGSANPHA